MRALEEANRARAEQLKLLKLLTATLSIMAHDGERLQMGVPNEQGVSTPQA